MTLGNIKVNTYMTSRSSNQNERKGTRKIELPTHSISVKPMSQKKAFAFIIVMFILVGCFYAFFQYHAWVANFSLDYGTDNIKNIDFDYASELLSTHGYDVSVENISPNERELPGYLVIMKIVPQKDRSITIHLWNDTGREDIYFSGHRECDVPLRVNTRVFEEEQEGIIKNEVSNIISILNLTVNISNIKFTVDDSTYLGHLIFLPFVIFIFVPSIFYILYCVYRVRKRRR